MLLFATVAAVALGAPGPRFSPAGAASPFEATAAADLVRILVHAEPAVLQADLVDAGALTTQARLTSLGDSTSFASTPYPGSLAVSTPGLIDGLLQGAVDLPEYPLIASSSYPAQPHSRLTAGTLALTTDSGEEESRAIATDGASRSSATVEVDDIGKVVARADTTLGSFDLGPLLTLGGVRSSATVTATPDGTLQRRSEFSIASISVLGQRLELTDHGLALPGASVPGDAGAAIDAVGPLLAVLGDAGIQLRVLEPAETPSSITSAGLEISRTIDTQINGINATVTVTVGRASASVSSQVAGAPDGTTETQPSAPVALGGSSGLDLRPLPGAEPSLSPTPPRSSGSQQQRVIGSLRPETANGDAFYPVLVIAGFVLVGLVDLFRKRGVKLTWIS